MAETVTAAGTRRRFDAPWALSLWIFLATLVAHGLVALATPQVGTFAKYTSAVEGLRDGTLPPERLVDFSPLYLGVASMATSLAHPFRVEASTVLLLLHFLLAALAVSCFFCLVEARLGRPWGLAAAALLAFDAHLLVYLRILEPETLLLALLLALLVLLERPGRWAAAGAGLLAALAVATRPTFLPVFFLVPLYFRMQRGKAEESPPAPLFQRGEPRQESPSAAISRREEPSQESPPAPLSQRGEPRQGPARGEAGQGSGPPPLEKGDLEGDLHHRPGNSAADWKSRSALFLAPVLLALLLLSWRAHRISGSWTTPVMNPGTVMYEGNQPLSRGTSAVYPPLVLAMVRHGGDQPDSAHDHYRLVARAVELDAGVPRVNAMWSGRARAYLADEPGRALERLRMKILYAFHGFSWHDVPSAWRLEGLLPIPTLPVSLLSAAALLGLAVAARRWKQALPFYVLAAVQLGVMAAFYVSARQRLVLLPALVYFALCAVRSLLGPGRSWTFRAGVVLLVLALALPLALPDEAMLDEAHQRRGYTDAEPRLGALRDDDTPLAAQRQDVVEALAAAPWWLDWMRPAWVPQDDATLDELVADHLERYPQSSPVGLSPAFDLAAVQLEASRLDRAEELLNRLVEADFRAYRGGMQPSDPRILLARVEAARGDVDSALARLDRVLADEPGDLFALAERAALTTDPRLRDESVRLLDRYVGAADRRWLLGRALLRVGRAQDAVEQLQPLARSLPQLREVHIYLALALSDVGRVDEAARSILHANRMNPEPVLEVRAVADLARRWAEAHPNDAEVQLLAIRLLHQHGMFRDASRRLDGLVRLDLSPSDKRQVEEIRNRLSEAYVAGP